MGNLGIRRRFIILRRDNFCCRYCGRHASEVELEVDHIEPRSKGGTDDDDNLVSACVDCNRGKGALPMNSPSGTGPRVVSKGAAPGLVGKCFVIFGADKKPSRQGIVRAKIDEDHYLVQFFEWLMGEPSTMSIISTRRMAEGPIDGRELDQWTFFEDDEHLRYWLDQHKNI